MNKELEYINEIQNELDKNPRDKWKAYWNGRCNVIRESLTPPTVDEIVKELNELYANDNWVFSTNEFGNGEDMIYCDYEDFYDNKFKSITYELAIPIPLKLAHKITSFFMEVE